VKGYVEKAEMASRNGDYVRAAEWYRAALTLSPADPALRTALEQIDARGSDKLVEAITRQAEMLERFGRWADAAESWKRVVAARPTDREANRRLAEARARAGR
jgi:tetratricopeptide (TPR) repeat protein